MNRFKNIAVEGLIRSGKSELVHLLSKKIDSKPLYDNRDNPFFDSYLKAVIRGDDSLSLKTQLIFLLNRYNQQIELDQKDLFHKITISNYIFERDGIYAHSILKNDDDLSIYKKIYSHFLNNIIKPDLVIYLQISFAEMLRRINVVENEIYRDIPNEYWREIFEAYNYFFFNYKRSPLLVINVEKIDFNDPKYLNNLIDEIKNHKTGVKYYAPA